MKRCAAQTVLLVATFGLPVIPMLSQTTPSKRSFEVVSIKPSPPGNGLRGLAGPRGDRFTMSGATLRMLLQYAYSPTVGLPLIQSSQIVGAPNWIDSDRFDVEAKADCSGGPISQDQMVLMLQSLLEARFQLKAHLETRESPAYDLVAGKGGPKIKAAEDQTPPTSPGTARPAMCAPPAAQADGGQRGIPFDPRGPLPRGTMRISGGTAGTTMSAAAVPITNLVNVLQQQTGRAVIDKTDLKGLFDFQLQFSPEGFANLATPFGPVPNPGAGAPGAGPGAAGTTSDVFPSLFTVVQEQLGLKLESSQGTIQVLVIESVQKPTAN